LSPKKGSKQGKIVTTGLPAQHNKIRSFNMTFKAFTACALALMAFNPAQAATASTNFTLDSSTPIFSFNAPPADPTAVAGQWRTDNIFYANTRTSPAKEASLFSSTLPPSATAGAAFGTAQGGIASSAEGITTDVKYQVGSISTAVTVSDRAVRTNANMSAVWSRAYQLSPNASLTFSGTTTLRDIGTQGPIDFSFSTIAQTDPLNQRIGSAYLSGNSVNNGIYLSAILTDCDFTVGCPPPNGSLLDTSGAFSYKTSPEGVFSLTISNTLDTTAYGNLRLNINTIALASAVPEPQTYLLMLAGLGLVGAAIRKRNKAA
jgi:PEP-CTERM motif